MDLGLSGLVHFVTGASGGIGFACARVLVEEGARVALLAGRRREALEARVREEGWKDEALVLATDTRDASALERAMRTAAAHFGRVDGLVDSAGVWPPEDRPLHEMPLERLETTVATNLLGAMNAARAFLTALALRGPRPDGAGASVVFVGSTAGRFGEAGHADYAVTKAALRGLTLTLKNEIVALDPRGRVNLVEPGWTKTPMAEGAMAEEGAVEGALRTMALARVASAGDIARVIVGLASPLLSRHVTGEVVTVAGGMEGRVLRERESVDRAAALRGDGVE